MNVQKVSELISGVQHLGIPAVDIEAAAVWYEQKLGFTRVYEKQVYLPVRLDMIFMQLGNLMIELYRPAAHLRGEIAARTNGVIDHFAIDAPDFAACAKAVYHKGAALHESTPDGCVLYDHIGAKGVRGVNFSGPNGEVVELCHDYNAAYGEETGLTGWSHLAIRVSDLGVTLPFYEKLGFHKKMDGYLDTLSGRMTIVFAENHGFTLELIQVVPRERAGLKNRKPGRLDHIALDVTDARQAYYLCKKEGFAVTDTMAAELPVFEHGVRYFTILGPDGERIELNERIRW